MSLPWKKFDEMSDMKFLDTLKNYSTEEIQTVLSIYEEALKFNRDIRKRMSSRNWKNLYSKFIQQNQARIKWTKQILNGKI